MSVAVSDPEAAAVEAKRLAVLANLRILDTPPERVFNTVVNAAKALLGRRIALISLVDDHRQWFKARCGLSATETPRDQAFCAHAVRSDDLLLVPDATRDARFADNPLVTGPPHIRFYAGMPIRVDASDDGTGGYPVGTLCVIDDAPGVLSPQDEATLRNLAHLVEALLHARSAARLATELAEAQRHLVRSLNRTHRQFRQAERMANVGSWRLSLDTQRAEWSDQVYAIHGVNVGEKPDLAHALDFYPPQARTVVASALARVIETGASFDIEADFITAQGEMRRIRSLGELDVEEDGAKSVIGVFQDITDRHILEQELRQIASVDVLTGLANRARYQEVADHWIAAARAEQKPLALLLIDLDNFKTVNDTRGHLEGDTVLTIFAHRLRSLQPEAFAARLGGDEFALLVRDPDAVCDLPAFLATLLGLLVHEVRGGQPVIRVSATIGACWLTADVGDRSELLHRADIALYEAKVARRGTAKIYATSALIAPAEAAPVRLADVRKRQQR
jgi:diguanylate cyclase (GGDEF)-like protein